MLQARCIDNSAECLGSLAAGLPEKVAGLAHSTSCCVQHSEQQGHLTGQAELLLRVWCDGQHGLPDGRYEEEHL